MTQQEQWDGGAVPDGLAAALGGNSLGNPAVVDQLLAGFVATVGQLGAQCLEHRLSGDELDAHIKDGCTKLGRAFSGFDERYVTTTWNTAALGGLQSKARALLAGERTRSGFDDNFDPALPVAGLFYLLARQALGALKDAAEGKGEPGANHPLPRTMRYLAGVLLGHPEAPQ